MNKIVFDYRKDIVNGKIFIDLYGGISNQDLENKFNDFLFGIKTGIKFLEFKKSNLYGNIGTGIYFPNSNFHNATTLFAIVHT